MYMEGEGGKLVSSVVDIRFGVPDTEDFYKNGQSTRIGSGTV